MLVQLKLNWLKPVHRTGLGKLDTDPSRALSSKIESKPKHWMVFDQSVHLYTLLFTLRNPAAS